MSTKFARLRRLTLTVTLGLGLSAPALLAGPQSAVAAPQPAAVSTNHRLDRAALQSALDDVTAGDGVGAVAQVKGPQGSWSSASGVRRLSGRAPAARAGDQVRIASVTKSMVATLVLQEVQRGRWKLTTRVDQVLPGLLPGHGNVTLAQLLSHRSGLPDFAGVLVAGAVNGPALVDAVSVRYTDRQLVTAALTLPWTFAPGTSFGYSNTNYVVLGMMLAKVNHRSLSTLLERRVFKPARMTDSSFPRTARIRGAHLTEYAIVDKPYSLKTFEPSFFSSAGAVVSTARDVNRFYAALLQGKLVKRSLVQKMITPLTDEPLAYGLGVYALPDPCPTKSGGQQLVYGHDGASFGTLTIALSSPDARRQVTVAVTGRSFVVGATPPPYIEFAYEALAATCPRPVPTTPESRTRAESPV
ncbi:MAG: serine hydrolase domain-containing protein, partial [Propionibacteriaceae bacterium]